MTRQPTGQAGEIIVQGPTVFAGYEDDPQATAQVLVDGWYRTGDLGYLDEDGHLFISGRIKDVINRGGQKLSPNEIETVLLEHPVVKAAAVFGIPDPQLGEDVAAAVVIKADFDRSNVTISGIQAFVAEHLVAYKVPRQIIVVDEIPLTPIGKIDRKRLGGLLSLAVADGDSKTSPLQQESSRTKTESDLVRLWAEVLKIPETAIGLHDSFQSLGGVSLSAVQLIFKVRSTFGINLSIIDFFNAPTIAIQAEIVNQILQRGTTGNPPSNLMPIKPGGSRAPLYCLHALNGGVYLYRAFVPFLDPEQPLYGLQAIGLDDGQTPVDNVDSMAEYHMQQIKAVQLKGPYFLCGFSFGGRLALEVGRRLRAEGHRDVYVLIIDDHLSASQFLKQFSLQRRVEKMGISRLASLWFGLLRLPGHYRNLYVRQKTDELWRYIQKKPRMSRKPDWMLEEDDLLPEPVSAIKEASKRAALSYTMRPYEGPVVYLRAANDDINIILFRALKYMAKGPFSLIDVPGVHSSLMTDQAHVQRVACEIQQWLDAANQAQPAV